MKKVNLSRLLLVLLCCILVFPGNAGIAEGSRADASAGRLPDSVLMTYYDHSMFAGDSLICMFRNYVRARQKADPQYFAGIDFRCAYSFTLQMAAWEKVMESSSANLKYKAREMTLSQIAQTLQPEKIFVLAGLNDNFARKSKGETGIERGLRYVEAASGLIRKAVPDTELFFISLTPVTKKIEDKRHIQELWDDYNRHLEEKCAELGVGYIDIASSLKDENGLLPGALSHDKEYHLNDAGNEIFAGVLLDYAQAQYEAGRWSPSLSGSAAE